MTAPGRLRISCFEIGRAGFRHEETYALPCRHRAWPGTNVAGAVPRLGSTRPADNEPAFCGAIARPPVLEQPHSGPLGIVRQDAESPYGALGGLGFPIPVELAGEIVAAQQVARIDAAHRDVQRLGVGEA